MTHVEMNWFSPSVTNALGWALVHFLWQGASIAALAAAAMALFRRSSWRHIVGVGALFLMLLAPMATFLLGLQRYAGAADRGEQAPQAVTAWLAAAANPASIDAKAKSFIPSSSSLSSSLSSDGFLWIVDGWLLGVAFLSLRSAGGFVLLARRRRCRSFAISLHLLETCRALQDRIGVKRAIRYCECMWLQAPAVVGWFRPIVFLPESALTGLSEAQLRSVIAHELAHIRRLDPFVNLFQVFLETLFFYHPAVWWLNKKIRGEREHCCDEIAVSVCGNAVEYARALTLMEQWRSAPMLAAAANGGSLKERVFRLLALKSSGAQTRGVNLTCSILCLAGALAAGNALLAVTHPPLARAERTRSEFIPAETVPRSLAFAAPVAMPSQQSTPEANAAPKPSAAIGQGAAPQDNDEPAASASYIDQMKSVGLDNLTADQLIALKVQDVTPEYVRGIQQEGLHPSAEKLIGMRVQGVTPEYVHEWRAAGLNPDEDQIIALKVQNIDGDYYRGLVDSGIRPDLEHLIGMKVQGVTPEYVRALHAAGLTMDADRVIALKVQDVTPEYLKSMHELGIDLRAEDAIAMRVQDVTPEYIGAVRALGLTPSIRQLIAMRVQDVTPEYIKALQSAGFKFSINELISAKVQDVTPEFIQDAVKHGFKDLTLQKLIELRRLGILDQKADL